MYRRSLLLLCSVGAVALTTAPAAFAGGEDPVTVTVTTPAPPPVTVTTPAPPPVTVTTPAPPPAPAPAPAPKKQSSNKKSTSAGSGGGGENESSENQSVSSTSTFQTVAQTHPIGGVQAGGGGTAPVPGDSNWLALALAGGSMLLLVSGGRLIALARTRGR
jgi:hypothetical protein